MSSFSVRPVAVAHSEDQLTPGSSSGHAQTFARELLELTRDQCLEVIAQHAFGRVAVAGASAVPVIRPVNYVWDPGSQSVAFRTAQGSKFHALVRAAEAVFEVDDIDPASRTGLSVIIQGVAEEVVSPADVRHLNESGLDSWPPGERAHWVRIRARTVSGRQIVQGGDGDP